MKTQIIALAVGALLFAGASSADARGLFGGAMQKNGAMQKGATQKGAMQKGVVQKGCGWSKHDHGCGCGKVAKYHAPKVKHHRSLFTRHHGCGCDGGKGGVVQKGAMQKGAVQKGATQKGAVQKGHGGLFGRHHGCGCDKAPKYRAPKVKCHHPRVTRHHGCGCDGGKGGVVQKGATQKGATQKGAAQKHHMGWLRRHHGCGCEAVCGK